MIDLLNEHLLPLKDIANVLPRRKGKKISFSTIWRWAERGLRGVKLETIRCGGTLYTSTEALHKFAEALTTGQPMRVRTSKQRQRAVDAAEAQLKKAGF